MGIWYTTREDLKAALDVQETARNNGQVDRAIEAASRTVEGKLHRKFYPWQGTKYFDWPNRQYARTWRLWLDQHELLSVSALVSGGTTIAPGDYLLEPVNDPPYDRIEINLAGQSSFNTGDTHQRDIAITGVWGYSDESMPAGQLAADLDVNETSVGISDSALVGVGDVLLVDNERMVITERSMSDTGQNASALSASTADVSITGVAGLAVNEVILVDSERMLVVDVAGTTLTVRRAYDGSTLAAHNASADIYALRTLTVERGALGTTATTHSNSAAIRVHEVPGLVSELCMAYALNNLLQRQSGYARTSGEGDNAKEYTGRGIKAILADAQETYGRRMRLRAV